MYLESGEQQPYKLESGQTCSDVTVGKGKAPYMSRFSSIWKLFWSFETGNGGHSPALSRLAPSGVTPWQRCLGATIRGTSANHLGGLGPSSLDSNRLGWRLQGSVGLQR